MQVLLFLHRLYFFVILNIRNKKTYKMKKIIFLFIISSLISIKGIGLTLSPETEVSILTCAPGNELYSLFGHTAIRINDPRHQIDRVYNYGTFDFSTPHFYLKYARGLLPYQLTVQKFSHFIYNYQLEERTVYAQTIRLDSLEKQRIFDLLEENLLPQNRYYLYNFIFDNCTTRSRDILLKSLPDSVAWNMPDVNKNFWNLLDEYLQASPWVQWGIHTILGQRGNRTATTFQYMFLPDYLMYGLKNARYDGQLLAEPAEVLYQAPEMNLSNSWYGTPLFVFALGCLLLILLLQYVKSRSLLNVISLIFLLFTGIVGILIVFLGGFTAHPITAPNWNILWANPLNLFVIPFIFRKALPLFIRKYLKFYLAILAIAIPVWAIAQPAVPMASISLIILMIYLCFRLRNEKR